MAGLVQYTVGQVVSLSCERLDRLRKVQAGQGPYDLNPVETADARDDPAIHYAAQVSRDASRLLRHADVDALYGLCVHRYGAPQQAEKTEAARRLAHLVDSLPQLIAQLAVQRGCRYSDVAGMPCSEFMGAVGSATRTPTTAKRSTVQGEGEAKLIAALTRHHQYAEGGCLNLEPIGNNELARQAGVAVSTASAFFKNRFRGYDKYRATCADKTGLAASLKLLNQEFSPHLLYGAKPPGEDERDRR